MPIVRQSLKPIETAYRQFLKKEGGLPRFHAKYVRPDSFPLCTGAFRMRGRYLYIARIGEVLLLGHNPYPDGVPKSGTVKRECGRWYAYITYEVERAEVSRAETEVGIDRNVGQVTCSDGVVYRMPDTARHERRVRRYQRMMARRRGPNRKKGDLCTACGHRDNADVNAALNILAFGNRAAGRGGSEKTLEEFLFDKARPVKRQMGIVNLRNSL